MTETQEAPQTAPTEAPAKPKKPADPEFVALKRISSILGGLSDGAKRRVLSYFVDRAVPV